MIQLSDKPVIVQGNTLMEQEEAAARGIGSLWVGNVFFAYDELTEWIGKVEMILAMSFRYAEKEGYPLPRKKETDVIEVRD